MAKPTYTKFNLTRVNAICSKIKSGVPPATAARTEGITEQTHYAWLRRGRKGEEPYTQYVDRVEQAEAEAETDLVQRLNQYVDRFGSEDPSNIKFLLEKRFKKDFGKEVRIEARGMFEKTLELLPHYMSRDAWAELLRALQAIQNRSEVIETGALETHKAKAIEADIIESESVSTTGSQ